MPALGALGLLALLGALAVMFRVPAIDDLLGQASGPQNTSSSLSINFSRLLRPVTSWPQSPACW